MKTGIVATTLAASALAISSCTGQMPDPSTSSTTGSPSSSWGTQVDLPVSDWSPQGGSAFGLSLQGTLFRDDQCVRFRLDDGTSVTPVWPSGYTAYLSADVITVLDDKGRPIARTGERGDYVGGYGEAPYPNSCTSDPNGTFLVQEDVYRGY